MNLSTTQIAFIDANVPDIQTLINSILPNIDIFVLHPHEDGVKQITQRLATYQNIQAIHIISHGSPGTLYLGNGVLSDENLHQYTGSLQQWRNALTPDAEILLYGCKVAGDPHPPVILSKTKNPNVILFAQRRQRRNEAKNPSVILSEEKNLPSNFVQRLSQLTGAKIAGSTTNIGHVAKGGNWKLDFCTSPINTPLAITPAAVNAYTEVLNGEFVWVKQLGGTEIDNGYSITVDSAGNVYTTGYFNGIGDFDPGPAIVNLTSAGLDDSFISKLDANGNFLWAKQLGGAEEDRGSSITLDSAGNIYTTGWFNGTVDFDPGPAIVNLTSAGVQDSFISKLDANGNFLWAKQLGGTDDDIGSNITVDIIGNIYTTGFFIGEADFDPGPAIFNLTSAGVQDSFISKLDANGNFLWAKPLGGTDFDRGTSITLDSAGNIYTTGYFNGTADFDPGPAIVNLTSAGVEDSFISKLDAEGNFLWAKQLGGTEPDRGFSINLDSAGNVYTSGYFNGTADFDPGPAIFNLTSAGFEDSFISKLDADGNFLWAKQLGGISDDLSISITVDNFGDVYTTDTFIGTVDFDPGPGIFNLTSAGFEDSFISKLDAEGNFLWAKQLGSISDDNGTSITVDSAGNIYTTGFFTGTADFDLSATTAGDTLTSLAGSADVYVLKLGFAEIEVLDGVTNILDGSTIPLNFGPTLFGTPLTKTFTINNTGTAFLNLSTLTLPAGFTPLTPLPTSIAPATTATFNVQLDATALGTYTSTLQFVTNDEDETPFDFAITGTVLPQLQLAAGTLPTESGTTGTFNLTLSAALLTDLVVNFNTLGSTATNLADYTFTAGNNITAVTANSFTIAAGQTTATLNVVPVDDGVVDPNETVTLNLDSGVGYIIDATTPNATLTIEDNEPTISIIAGEIATEAGTPSAFTINLSNAPTTPVTVNFTVGGTATNANDYSLNAGNNITNLTENSLTIAAGVTTATLNLVPINDAIIEPNETVTLNLDVGAGYVVDAVNNNAEITLEDNDIEYALTAGTPIITEGNSGTQAVNFTITRTGRLDVSSSVDFNLAGTATNPDDYTFLVTGTGVSTTNSTINFAPNTITATVTLNIAGDSVVENAETIELSLSNPIASAGFSATIPGVSATTTTINNDDSAGVIITPLNISLIEGGTTGSFAVRLQSSPIAPVFVNFNAGNQINPLTSLTFDATNWNLPQTVNVSAIDDTLIEGFHTEQILLNISSNDLNYNAFSVDPIAVNITDNDTEAPVNNASILIQETGGNTNVIEGGISDTYQISLTGQPTANVTLNLTTNNQIAPISPITFTPANWNLPQTVTVAAINDLDVEGTHSSLIRHTATSSDANYNGKSQDVAVTITDNDTLPAGTPGINLIQPLSRLDVREGFGSDVYKIKLNSKPTENVVLTITPDQQTTTDLQTLTFTPDNWNLAQNVTINANDDSLLEAFKISVIRHTVSSLDPTYNNLFSNLSINVNDNDNLGIIKNFTQSESWAGTAQDDFLIGSLQSNILYGRAGNNYLNGNAGDDILFGGDNSDGITGNDGNDQLLSGSGDDYIEGNAGDDIICAGAGSDRLHGGEGNDFLVADAGNDRLIGDAGGDTLIGGLGRDAFVMGVGTGGITINQADLIMDFTDNQDVIDLINSLTFSQLNITQGTGRFASDTVITNINTGEYLAILKNVAFGIITEADFV